MYVIIYFAYVFPETFRLRRTAAVTSGFFDESISRIQYVIKYFKVKSSRFLNDSVNEEFRGMNTNRNCTRNAVSAHCFKCG